MTASAASFIPPPAWRATFEKEVTRELIEKATRYAKGRVKLIERVGRKVDPLYARELVQDALGDTLEGTVAWDPARATLMMHVVATIHSRTRHAVVRAVKMPHRSLDDSADDNSTEGRPLEAEASRALERAAGRPSREEAAGVHATRTMEALRQLGGDDASLLQLLGAYEHGATEKHEVMRLTGMSAATYNNARRRMVRLVAKLPAHVRDTADDLLD